MKVILCYGDSNTWGEIPLGGGRYGPGERWTGALAQELGPGCRVIEEGLGGRTTVWEDPIEGYKNGREYLIPCLDSHKPLDLVVLMLGTNDLKMRFSVPAADIAGGVAALVEIIQKSGAGVSGEPPKILLMAPPPLGKLSDFAEMFEGGLAKSLKLGAYYRRVAEELGCAFLDAGEVIRSSDLDGVHFDRAEHQKLSRAVAARVREMLEVSSGQ
jgi:lysophospholipase L1-like esterase